MTDRTVAALYVDPRGPYPTLAGVECWDVARDARLYAGPHPIVAHPPCGPWGRLRHFSSGRDKDCAPRAVEQVRAWGGVLEHPAYSTLWQYCALPRPSEAVDTWGGYTIEVNQVNWGHVARKRTWLYLCLVPEPTKFPPPREPTHWVAGAHARVPPGIKICSAQQRRRTPVAFAIWLVALARSVVA